MARITIIGSGFAALTTIRELRRQGVDAEIVVVSPHDSLTYLPSLIWVPPGLTGPAWLDGSDLPRSAGGFVVADALCRVPDRELVYVAGDAGSYPARTGCPSRHTRPICRP